MTDSIQLLRDYAERGDESAFRELVSRYIHLVYSAAVRRVGGDADLARDVTQAVFTDLARKAHSLREVQMLGGWLHRHTGFVAATLLRSERSRRVRELQVAEMNALLASADSDWQQLAPVLDETIDTLDPEDRQAILLRFFEQKDFRSVGAALGVSDDTAQKRVSRALEKLRSLLVRRGITFSALLLANLLAAKAVAAAPAELASGVCRIALGGATVETGFVAGLMKLLSSVPAAAWMGALIVAVSGLVVWQLPDSAQRPGSQTIAPALQIAGYTEAGLAPAEPLAASASVQNDLSASNQLLLRIVAADTGEPVASGPIDCWLWPGDRSQLQISLPGICVVPFPRDSVTRLMLVTQIEGFADTRLDWRTDRGETISQEYTLRLTRPVSIGGTVVDSEGRPVAGARIGFGTFSDPVEETRPEMHAESDFETFTDAEGRWHLNRIAPEVFSRIGAGATHPEHVSSSVKISKDPVAGELMRAGKHVFRLGKTVVVHGVVVDSDDRPVAEANLLVGEVSTSNGREGVSQPDGTFHIIGCEPGKTYLTAAAKGFAPVTIPIELKEGMEPFRIVVERGLRLRMRAVNQRGEPVPGANVWLNRFDQDRDSKPLQINFQRTTDANGRMEWEDAPAGEHRFDIQGPGCMRVSRVRIAADGVEHEVVLPPVLTLSGTVRDARTGEPIPRFRIILGWPQGGSDVHWSGIDRFWLAFEGGKFRHVLDEPLVSGTENRGCVLKFEAEGYAPFVTRTVAADEGEARIEVELKAAGNTAVEVVLPDGRPAAGADIGLVSAGARLQLVPGGFSRESWQAGGSQRRTDDQGRFRLPADEMIERVIAAHPEGYRDVTVAELQANPSLQLQPWGRLEGVFLTNSQPFGGARLQFQFESDWSRVASDDFETTADSNGRFAYDQVPAGRHQIVWRQPVNEGSWTHVPLTDVIIRPGETAQAVIGGTSCAVTLRVRYADDVKPGADWRKVAFIHLGSAAEQRTAAQPLPQVMRYRFEETSENSFIARGVDAGDYLLSVRVQQPPSPDHLAKTVAPVLMTFTVPANSDVVDLGEILLKPAP